MTPKKGFTLIELLVVIAIIAILAAILFPVFASARAKAYQAACTSNMNQLNKAVMMYVQDYDGDFPISALPLARNDPNRLAPGTVGTRFGYRVMLWMGAVQPYIKNSQVFACPSEPRACCIDGSSPGSGGAPNSNTNRTVLPAGIGYTWTGRCTGGSRPNPNQDGVFLRAGPPGDLQACVLRGGPLNQAQVTSAADTIYFWDVLNSDWYFFPPPTAAIWFRTTADCLRNGCRTNPSPGRRGRDIVDPRHNDGVVVGYLDGHVKFVKLPANLTLRHFTASVDD